jgi:hypothetical protein
MHRMHIHRMHIKLSLFAAMFRIQYTVLEIMERSDSGIILCESTLESVCFYAPWVPGFPRRFEVEWKPSKIAIVEGQAGRCALLNE